MDSPLVEGIKALENELKQWKNQMAQIMAVVGVLLKEREGEQVTFSIQELFEAAKGDVKITGDDPSHITITYVRTEQDSKGQVDKSLKEEI
ncbi:hypothetical protein PP175_26075 (plasmid) [Aneurinibacillus sp. Ricciae_BoGa-3]|uniref:hypothetical protein n=1 Tax=Aneurinibacillus sp. Ricciae_BoGa-3 TaxID=3022697 RepID=UPI0023408463|nr:hypothetical protein [Aneurinibacillus sp. Ricciae_BoGa-3]WCK57535.1 hypothetical protein PP175_26075 [Aneurinibacillus sp. Ricciae_BoGa-3]